MVLKDETALSPLCLLRERMRRGEAADPAADNDAVEYFVISLRAFEQAGIFLVANAMTNPHRLVSIAVCRRIVAGPAIPVPARLRSGLFG
jgi:hypothetical protein